MEIKLENDKKEIEVVARQKSMGFPWLAEAYGDYFALKDDELEKYLRRKKHPAHSAADNVKMFEGVKAVAELPRCMG
ncbi:hypothetical protein [Acidihalobacter aeolianus]|uniref:hypothetical protein n=1 Tax=Acidihalobacter aeolianus TaxID=2792603 RepID=UPI0012E9DB2E|nr:hypothetical protein [Acidihalobacter aeolianus]